MSRYYSKVTIEPMDVMDFLHPALANAFKYLDRAGKKPDNSYEQDMRKAYDYIDHYFQYARYGYKEDPRAFTILKFYLNKNRESTPMRAILMDASVTSVEDFFYKMRAQIQDFFLDVDKNNEDHEVLNVMAKLMHKKMPYPENRCPVDHYKNLVKLFTEEDEDGSCKAQREVSDIQQKQDCECD